MKSITISGLDSFVVCTLIVCLLNFAILSLVAKWNSLNGILMRNPIKNVLKTDFSIIVTKNEVDKILYIFYFSSMSPCLYCIVVAAPLGVSCDSLIKDSVHVSERHPSVRYTPMQQNKRFREMLPASVLTLFFSDSLFYYQRTFISFL